jgi:hypothetical protein
MERMTCRIFRGQVPATGGGPGNAIATGSLNGSCWLSAGSIADARPSASLQRRGFQAQNIPLKTGLWITSVVPSSSVFWSSLAVKVFRFRRWYGLRKVDWKSSLNVRTLDRYYRASSRGAEVR